MKKIPTRIKLMLGITLVAVFAAVAVPFGNDILVTLQDDTPSVSVGTPSNGSLEHGKRLPSAGKNFRAYSDLATLFGRNSVHSLVRTIVLEAYEEVASEDPELFFVYGESGWPSGGRFRPHRTHQNGTSIDFMVPVRDSSGRVVPFPAHLWNRLGYGLEFDEVGRAGELQIDFEALAVHLAAVQRAATRHGARIRLFIIAPEFQPLLWKTRAGQELKDAFPVMTKPAWIRHDEHYHVDFELPAGA